MKFRLAAVLGVVAVMAAGRAAEPAAAVPPLLPVEEFAYADIASGLALSRDGRTIAYSTGRDREWLFVLRDWETGKTRNFPSGGPATPVWTSAERLITSAGSGMNRDGTDERPAARRGPLLQTRLEGPNAGDVLSLRFDVPVAGRRQLYFRPAYPHVDRLNPIADEPKEQVRNPGTVDAWLADAAGLVRVGNDTNGVLNRVIWREREGGEWRVPPGLEFSRDQIFPRWLSADGTTLFLAQRTPAGTWGLFSYDLATGSMGEMILGHDRFDLRGHTTPVLAPRTRALLGLYFHGDTPRVKWFDPQMATVQQALDQALAGRVNRITDLSDDLQRMIVASTTARDPGTHYQFDLETKSLKPIFPVRPWIKPAQMAEVFPASYTARDGQVVRGYLTLPVGRAAKNLPLVIVAHDGPGRRAVWEFDQETQFLANRGYAVLAINYRGSRGYGRDYEEQATRHTSTVPPDDLADGARWAVAQGLADPRRIALLGHDFGGTAALLGLARDAELYRCAIGVDAVTDWTAQLAHFKQGYPAGFAWLLDRIGDPERDAAELRAASPLHHAEKIAAPVLLVYSPGESVSRDDSRAFRAALARLKKPHEVLGKEDDLLGFVYTPGRVELLTRMEKFLVQHLGPTGAEKPSPT
ncbi:MAG: hypothetical protein RLZZ15_527, partial [Verrucomicrobiota bacterium]